jgi:hypothetical protein
MLNEVKHLIDMQCNIIEMVRFTHHDNAKHTVTQLHNEIPVMPADVKHLVDMR